MKKSLKKSQKIFDDLFKKIEEKIIPNIAYFADRFEDGIVDISVTDEEIVNKYKISYNNNAFFYEALGNVGFLRIITKENDGDFEIFIVEEKRNCNSALKETRGLDGVCRFLMIDNNICLMDFSKLLLKVLDYYLEKEKELCKITKEIDSLGFPYQNNLLTEKISNKNNK